MNQHDVSQIGSKLEQQATMTLGQAQRAAQRILAQMQSETASKFTKNIFSMLNLTEVSAKIDARLAAKKAK